MNFFRQIPKFDANTSFKGIELVSLRYAQMGEDGGRCQFQVVAGSQMAGWYRDTSMISVFIGGLGSPLPLHQTCHLLQDKCKDK